MSSVTLQIGKIPLEIDKSDEKLVRALYPCWDFKFKQFYINILSFDNKQRKTSLAWILTGKIGVVRFNNNNRHDYTRKNLSIEEFRDEPFDKRRFKPAVPPDSRTELSEHEEVF